MRLAMRSQFLAFFCIPFGKLDFSFFLFLSVFGVALFEAFHNA